MNNPVPQDPPHARRTALITGVSRKVGIGAAAAQALAETGLVSAIFTTFYRPFDQATYPTDTSRDPQAILDTLRASGIQADGIEADLSDPTMPAFVFGQAIARFGHIDILINNAAFDVALDLNTLTPQLLDQHYAVNVRGATLLCAEFFRAHDGRPGGRVVNLTSGQMITPMPDNLPYAISKGAVEALTISIAPTMAHKGITVNAVDPGGTDTGWMTEGLRTALASQSPFGRVGRPEDAANLIAFLCSGAAGWITGQVIRSRGGL